MAGISSKPHSYQSISRGSTSFSGHDCKVLLYVPLLQPQILDIRIAQLKEELGLSLARVGEQGISSFGVTPTEVLWQSFADEIPEALLAGANAHLAEELQDLIAFRDSGGILTVQTLQTLSWQIHADKRPVKASGHRSPKAWVTGPRMVAGSMIFTVMDGHPLNKLIRLVNLMYAPLPNSNGANGQDAWLKDPAAFVQGDMSFRAAAIDQIPPLNCQIIGVNEAGDSVSASIYGIEFMNDGCVLSVQDILTENTVTWVAQDFDPLTSLSTGGKGIGTQFYGARTVTDILNGGFMEARRQARLRPW